jgi:polygalacturonase
MGDKKTILFLLLALKTSMLCASPDTLDNYQFHLGIISGEKCEWLAGSNKNIRVTTHPLQDTQGFIVEVLPLRIDTGAKLCWSFGGITPERCKDNVYSIEGNAFTLYYGETYALQTIQACVPPESVIHLSDAPALTANLPIKASEKYYFCFYRQTVQADYNYFMLEELFARTSKDALHERLSLPYMSEQVRLTRASKSVLYERLIPTRTNGYTFNVKDFGATGDGKTIDSDAINQAIETLADQGGGTIYFPAGKYLSYSIRLKSHIRLLLDAGAELIAAFPSATEGYDAAEPNEHNRYQDFGHSHWKNSLLWAIGEEDITICGQGLINGRGLSREESRLTGVGNKAISLKECRNIVLRDIKMFRCGHFALLATGVENLTVDNLLIDTNRDGLDIDCCRNVHISNCTVNSPWDDAIVLKASYGLGSFKDTENVMITNCMVSGYDWGTVLDGTYRREQHQAPDQAFVTGRIKFGTESSGGFRNITISNCVFDRCRGLALETVDGGCLEDITVSNITMRDIVNAPIFLRLGARMRSPEGTPVGKMRRIRIDNINVINADSRYASIISGIPGHCIEDVTLSNIRIRYKGGYDKASAALTPPEHERRYPEPAMFGTIPASAFFVRHARNIRFHHINVDFIADDFRPAFVLDDATDISIIETTVALPAGVAITELRNLSTMKETQSNIKE